MSVIPTASPMVFAAEMIVAGEHDRPQPASRERRDGGLGLRPRFVGEAQASGKPAVDHDEGQCPACAEFFGDLGDFSLRRAEVLRQALIAERYGLSLDFAGKPQAIDGLHVLCRRQRYAREVGIRHQRLAERMLAFGLDRRCEAQHALDVAIACYGGHDGRAAERQRAGLVEGDGADVAGALKGFDVADQDAGPRGANPFRRPAPSAWRGRAHRGKR